MTLTGRKKTQCSKQDADVASQDQRFPHCHLFVGWGFFSFGCLDLAEISVFGTQMNAQYRL